MDLRDKNEGAPQPGPAPLRPTPPPMQQELPLSGAIEPTRATPLWRRRLWLALYVLASLAVGYVLLILPWRPNWSHHALLAHSLTAQRILAKGFTRGLFSGLGFLNIWMAVWAATHYRETRPPKS